MMQISKVLKGGLSSGDCGGHLSTVNSATFKKSVRDDLSFGTWCIILLEVEITRWVQCGHKGFDMPEPLIRGRMDHSPLTLASTRIFTHRTVAHWIFFLSWTILCQP